MALEARGAPRAPGPSGPRPASPARPRPRLRRRRRRRRAPGPRSPAPAPARPRSPSPRAGRPPAALCAPVAPDDGRTRDGPAWPGQGEPAAGPQEAWMEPAEAPSLWSSAALQESRTEDQSPPPRAPQAAALTIEPRTLAHAFPARSAPAKELKRGNSQDLTISPKLDRYKIARQLTEKAIKEKKIFSIYGHYPVIRDTLRRKGWVEKKFHFSHKTVPSSNEESRLGTWGSLAVPPTRFTQPVLAAPGPHLPPIPHCVSSPTTEPWAPLMPAQPEARLGGTTQTLVAQTHCPAPGPGTPSTALQGSPEQPEIPAWDRLFAESRSTDTKEDHEGATETEDIYDVMSRLVKNETPSLLWTIKRDVVDHHSLGCEQMLNHYGKTASFTTKIGLCVNLRSLPWYVQADHGAFFPRCYFLCSQSEKQDFLDDFRLTAATSILKWVVSHQSNSRTGQGPQCPEPENPSTKKVLPSDPEDTEPRSASLSGELVEVACRVCQTYLGQLEHEDIDLSEEASNDLTEDEWEDLTQKYYSLIQGKAFIADARNHVSQCQALLNKLSSVNPQTEIDGLHNIWIIKPAAKSRGRDIMCTNRVEDILELVAAVHAPSKESKWVVQKYIETPLLIYDTKFDIRQWFLVTDWNPLTIWFYKESYLRFSTQRFSLDNLDSAIHLCNNSIQKRLKNDKERSPLLPGHNMWTSTRFQEYLQKKGRGAVWGSMIYPAMKRAIANTMRVAQDRVEPRKNSFELYGADFVLGRDFKPWLIEINSSPTMHPSTPVTAQLCAQVQRDTIKVVLDRKQDRDCDIGNFELLWRQPAVDLPPFHSSDLWVEGTSVRRNKRPGLPATTMSIQAPLLEAQPPKVGYPLATTDLMSCDLAGPVPQDPNEREAKGLSCHLPEQPRGKPGHATEARASTLASHLQRIDSKFVKVGLPQVEVARCRDLSLLRRHRLSPVLPAPRTWDPPGRLPGAPYLLAAPERRGLAQPLASVTMAPPFRAQPKPSALLTHVAVPLEPELPQDVQIPCLVCRGSMPPAQPCKRCRSFCASVLQGAAFVPLGGSPWTP